MARLRKHQYIIDGSFPIIPGSKVCISRFKCIHCGETTSSFHSWQLRDMPTKMAICQSPDAPKIGILERIFGINCLKDLDK